MNCFGRAFFIDFVFGKLRGGFFFFLIVYVVLVSFGYLFWLGFFFVRWYVDVVIFGFFFIDVSGIVFVVCGNWLLNI